MYYRTGLYKAPALPFIAGNEAAGEVLAVGPGVTNFHPGDRVAYYRIAAPSTRARSIIRVDASSRSRGESSSSMTRPTWR